MHDRERRGDPLVDQVGEEVVELVGGEHALVGEGARRQRREVDVGLVLGALAQAERQPLQRHAGHAAGPCAATKSWLNVGITPRAVLPSDVGLDRDVAPAEDGEALLVGELLDPLAGLGDLLVVAGQERRADGVRVLAAGSSKPASADLAQERVGDLHQDAGAVAGVGLGAGGAAVVEVAQGGEGLGHDVVAGLAGQGRDEGDAAGVVLVARVVEPLGRRERVRVGHRVLPSSSVQAAENCIMGAGDDIGPRGGTARLPPGYRGTRRYRSAGR